MPKFLVILPISIAGSLIMKGLAHAFNSCGYLAVTKDIRELKPEDLEELEISTIINYDYGFLHDEELTKYLQQNKKKYKIIHYFADDPNSKFANNEDGKLYKKLVKFNPFVFVWDKTYVNLFKKCEYLPLGVNPVSYETELLQKPVYDITFVGRPLGEKRQKILSTLFKIYGTKLKIFSYEKHFYDGADQMLEKGLLTQAEFEGFKRTFSGFVTKEKELAKIYSRSKINLNITIQGEDNMNYRVFEVLASAGFLLTDVQKCLKETFDLGKDLETYENEIELVDKIDFYLKNVEMAQRIALQGFDKVVNHHTFIDRARSILAIVEHL